MTVREGIQAGTKVSLTLADLLKQGALLVTIVGSSVLWTTSKLSAQREADIKQDERIAAVEQNQKRQEADSAAIAQTLTRFGDKLESVQTSVAEIRTGVARIDERTRSK